MLEQVGVVQKVVSSDDRALYATVKRHLAQQLADFAKAETDKTGEPAFLVGHSLGGFLSLMAAARHPELACGVLLIVTAYSRPRADA